MKVAVSSRCSVAIGTNMNDLSRPRRTGSWILIALLVVGGGYYWIHHGKQADVIVLEKIKVSRGNLVESIASTGTLSALEEVTIGSQVSGIVTKVLVDFNDNVKAGQLLAVVDPQTLQAQVDVSRAMLAQRQVTYDEAARQLKEGAPLREKGYLSDQDMRALEVAARTAKAQLESATVDFNKQNVQLTYAEIRSPISGVVMTRSVDPGNTVQASMQAPTLFVVASDLTKMKILANVDETQIAAIKEGMRARFTVSGIPDKTFNARVRQVRLKPVTTNNVVTYTVVLDAENPDKALFPGMTTTIDFIQSNIENQLILPSAALRIRMPNEMRVAADRQIPGSSSASSRSSQPQGFNAVGVANGVAGRQQSGAVWKVNAEGLAYRVPVRILGSDLTSTAIEPAQPDALQENDEVVIKVVMPNSSSSSSGSGGNQNRNVGMMPGPPGNFGGGNGNRGPR
jgi:HlyD family secretion protein